MTSKCTDINVVERMGHSELSHQPSRYSFEVSLWSWVILTGAHDLSLLYAQSERYTIWLLLLVNLALYVNTASAWIWAMSATEIWYSKVDELENGQPCGCVYRFGNDAMLLVMALPPVLLFRVVQNAKCLLQAVLFGDYLLTMTYRLAHRQVTASGQNPLEGSLIGATSKLLDPDMDRSDPPYEERPKEERCCELCCDQPCASACALCMPLVALLLCWLPVCRGSMFLLYRLMDLLGRIVYNNGMHTLGDVLQNPVVMFYTGSIVFVLMLITMPVVIMKPLMTNMILLYNQQKGSTWHVGRLAVWAASLMTLVGMACASYKLSVGDDPVLIVTLGFVPMSLGWVALRLVIHRLKKTEKELAEAGLADADCEWMYGDCGTGWLGIHWFAQFNPFRWSGSLTIKDGLEALHGVRGDRPVIVKSPSGVFSSQNHFDGTETAIKFLEGVQNSQRVQLNQ
jgi:hypothetical protein